MSSSEDNLIREVDEDIRRERLAGLWKRYGLLILTGVAVIVAGTAAYEAWRSHLASARFAAGMSFERADDLAGNAPEEAAKAFAEIAEEAPDGYALLARFRQGQALATKGDVAAAMDAYRQVAQGASEGVYRDLTIIFRALAVLGSNKAAGIDKQALAAELEPLTGSNNPWRFSARELIALIALERKEPDRAKEILETLRGDALTPPDMRTRADELLTQIDKG